MNKTYPFVGGVIEEVPAGEYQVQDQVTGQLKNLKIENHVLCIFGRRKAKLSGAMVRRLYELYDEEETFREWCEKCE